jgi:hypothetical protein
MAAERQVIDTHVHGFPDRLFDAIWAYFEQNYWYIHYKLYAEQVIDFMTAAGVQRFPLLLYAHKPNISHDLNTWMHDMGNNHPEILPFGTIHPEDQDIDAELDRALGRDQLDLRGLKLQISVTDFDPGIPAMDPVYEALLRHDKILVMHVGTGPVANGHVGIVKLRPVLERYPDLKLQVPHLGSYEYLPFFDLVRDYPNVYFDTAMIFVGSKGPFPDRFDFETMLDAFLEIQDHVMFGSDFPNIPYRYDVALNSISGLQIPEDTKHKIYFDNAAKFYGLD